MNPIQGMHHITAGASDPQTNVDFYELILGQRLVKTTVNFDDPGTYHLYYGDEIGTPGTIITFFPWLHVGRGQRGNGEAAAVAYAIPIDSTGFWAERLTSFGIEVRSVEKRFGENVLHFEDPDGMPLELVATEDPSTFSFWNKGPIPKQFALRGFHSVTLWLGAITPTANVLTEQLGYTSVGQEDERFRFQAASHDRALYIDLLHRPQQPRGTFGAGSIHHVAFRTMDDDELLQYRQSIHSAGIEITPVRDRQYFHSIYFREPGGVLFEVATDDPGFLYDEPLEHLGETLKLPTWLESRREVIKKRLLPFERKHNNLDKPI